MRSCSSADDDDDDDDASAVMVCGWDRSLDMCLYVCERDGEREIDSELTSFEVLR